MIASVDIFKTRYGHSVCETFSRAKYNPRKMMIKQLYLNFQLLVEDQPCCLSRRRINFDERHFDHGIDRLRHEFLSDSSTRDLVYLKSTMADSNRSNSSTTPRDYHQHARGSNTLLYKGRVEKVLVLICIHELIHDLIYVR